MESHALNGGSNQQASSAQHSFFLDQNIILASKVTQHSLDADQYVSQHSHSEVNSAQNSSKDVPQPLEESMPIAALAYLANEDSSSEISSI